MTQFVQFAVSSLAQGSLYALIALGYSLVYGVLRFINFAHSDVFMVGGWMSFVVASWLGVAASQASWWGLPVVLLSVMMFCAVLGVTIERLAYRPLRNAPRLNVLITAIGVSLFLQNVGQLRFIFGTQPQRMPELIRDATLFRIAEVNVRTVDVIVVLLALLLMSALHMLVFHSSFGRAMRAVSFDERIASLMGIRVNTVVAVTFAIGSALAAAGGLLFVVKYESLKQSADATWVLLGLKAFVAAVVGGIGNVRGAVAGAMLIGTAEMFFSTYVSTNLRDVCVFGILIAVLLVKPSGLFGKTMVEKV